MATRRCSLVKYGPTRSRAGTLPIKNRRYCLLILWALKRLQRRESNPLSSGYEPGRSPFAFAAIKGDTHPGLAPGKIGFADRRLVDLAMCVNETGQVRGTCTHPAGFTGLNAAGYIIT
jgi:hypothetical protein